MLLVVLQASLLRPFVYIPCFHRKGAHRDFERQCIDFATFWEVRLSRQASNAEKKACGNSALFGLRKKTAPDTISSDFGVPFWVRFRVFFKKSASFLRHNFYSILTCFLAGGAAEAGVV